MSVWEGQKVLETDGGHGCTSVNVLNTSELDAKKYIPFMHPVKTVKFDVMWILPLFKIN